MQCTENSGCFPQGKASSLSTALPNFFFHLCAMFSCFYTTGCEMYSFTTDGYVIFNVRTAQIWVRAVHTHERKSGTKQVCIARVDSDGQN